MRQRHILKTGAAGKAQTLQAHREYNARPSTLVHNQDSRDSEGSAGHIVTDAIR